MEPNPKPLLSVVVPVYNEAEVADELVRRLTAALAEIGDYEVLFVDDGSTDGSWERLLEHASRDERLGLIRLSRNFGHQIAITAGLDAARGPAVVIIDGDLQDPPELIPGLVAKWHEGYDVVYAVRSARKGETVFKRATATAFYRVLGRFGQVEIPAQAGDFRLLSRRAVDALSRMPERARFLRGMASWIGFRQIGVPYQREPRPAGTTKYPTRKMVRFAADAITSFSTAPLRLVSALGFVFVLFCFAYLAFVLYARLFTDRTVAGWTTVVVLILLIGGVQLLSLGVVGQYIARIFDEAKHRPLYFVDEIVLPGSAREAPRGERAESVGGTVHE